MKIELKLPDNTTRKFNFRFDFNAIAEYEEEFDRSPSVIKGMGVSTARNVAYIGFKEGDESFDLSLKDVGRAMTPDIMVKIFEAFGNDMSTMNGEEAKK